jgi:hypothetical protein
MVMKMKECLSIGVLYRDILCASGIYFISDDKIIFILGASTPLGKRHGAMRFMMDAMIQKYAQQSYSLDFEGSNTKGVDYLYKSFGGEKVYFLSIRKSTYLFLEKLICLKQSFRNK